MMIDVEANDLENRRRNVEWRSLEGLDLPEAAEAVRYAVTQGWMLVQGRHSVCLTDAGRRIVTPTPRS